MLIAGIGYFAGGLVGDPTSSAILPGLAGICASLGILFTTSVGGWLYASVGKGAPFCLIAP
ncbi:MAG: hypothetical protein EXR82_10700 [Gammaproteobacteria bacterium]|nr:hypothetical protein [Gammaproteobacteria bacterium]